MRKQAAVDQLTGERRGLQLQLEAVQKQIAELRARDHVITIPGGDAEEVRGPGMEGLVHRSLYSSETGTTAQVRAALAKAAVVADNVSLKAGVMLRRYPFLRLGLFVYVIVLHLWVVYVLMGSTPAVS